MSANQFIAELERRGFLSDRLMAKLRDSLATAQTPMSAEKMAALLVQKNQLTPDQASHLLADLSQTGVELSDDDGEAEPLDGGSIFGPAKVPNSNTEPPLELMREEEDEIRLVPIDEDFASQRSNTSALDDDDLPTLGVLNPDDSDLRPSHLTPIPQLAEVIEIAEPEVVYPRRNEEEEVAFPPTPVEQPLAEIVAPVRRTTSLGRDKSTKKRDKSLKPKKTWDSPLILIGGGGLVFLILVGGAIWFLLNWESGDQKLALAREALKSGAYPQAIDHYQEFIATSQRHAEHSLARIELAMLRIRQPTEAGDFPQAFAVAESETKAIEDESAFDDAHEELAALLPQIAQGLAKQAELAPPTSEDSAKLVVLSNKALELCDNANFIPKQLRDEAKLAAVRDTLELVERRRKSQIALETGLKEMEAAIAAGKPMGAYAAEAKLVREHPELADEKQLAEEVQKAAAAEKAAIRFTDAKQPAETAERPTPWLAALAVASHRGGTAPAQGTVCVRIDGAVYGLEAASGQLLWRRYVGFGSTGWPIPIGADVLIADTVRHELLRIDAETGRLVWRQSFKTPFGEPLVVNDRGFIGGDDGRVYVVDLKSGAIAGHLQFPQPIRIAPTLDRLKKHLYVTGDRASIYTISLSDMKCAGVYVTGHAPGTIRVPPVLVMDKLALAENNGVETSRLRLLNVNENFVIASQQANRRLGGLVTTSPVANGRSLFLATDRGQVEAYEIAPGNEGESLTVVATRPATGTQPITRHMAIVGRNIWLADTQLTKYNVVPANNRLPVEEIQNNFAGATFDHPIISLGDTIIEVHRPTDRPGAVVTAIETKQGRAFWETDLAVAPAGAPIADEANKSLTIANALGNAFRFDEAAIRSRVQDQPLAADGVPARLPVLTASADLGQGRAAFFTTNSDSVLLFNPAQSSSAKWLRLESPLVGGITPFGAGFIAPTQIGQVFFLSAADGSRLAVPFQPRIEPGSKVDYKQATASPSNDRSFVITDSAHKFYTVAVVDQPQPHLEASKEADVGPRSVTSPIAIIGNAALAIAGDSRLVRFQLPALESAGESSLPSPVEWGPYAARELALVATVDQKLIAIKPTGETRWQSPLEHGQLAGEPLVVADSVILAYRKGIIERRNLADGKPLGTLNVEHPLATGAVSFLQKLVVTAADGTLFVVQQP